MRIDELQPGDVVKDFILNVKATFIVAHHPHPLYPQLALVVWWMHEERRWSFDALHPQQELPYTQQVLVPLPPAPPGTWQRMRTEELRRVLLVEQQRG